MLKVYLLRLKQNTFDVTLKYKGVGVRVTFTDGNTYNGTPARCYTRDPFRQKAIEASQMFKDGDVVLERSVPEPGDDKPVQAKVVKVSKQKPVVSKPVAQKPVVQQPAPAQQDQQPEPPSQEEQNQKPAPENQEGDGGVKSMTFDNVGEAIIYVAQNFKVEVKTEKEARDVLKQNGINPTIKRG